VCGCGLPDEPRVIHPDTELRLVDREIGLGVFATRRLPIGTITWALDALDQRIPQERLDSLGSLYRPLIDRYAYLNGRGERILCWDIGRFMNHSCDANSISTGWDFDLAIRDIEAGEQITNDYALLNLDHAFACACGAAGCRGVVSSTCEDWEELTPALDERVRAACAAAGRVEQPLWRWVRAKASVRRAFRDSRQVLSVAEHRFDAIPTRVELAGAAAQR
jgi:hypothetical protein